MKKERFTGPTGIPRNAGIVFQGWSRYRGMPGSRFTGLVRSGSVWFGLVRSRSVSGDRTRISGNLIDVLIEQPVFPQAVLDYLEEERH
ncbi:MAG: hypothetical protein ACTSUE_08160 [Promethearchaeota archaeon]